MGTEQHPSVVLPALPALTEHHSGDSTGEVVIADVFSRDAAQNLEGLDVPFKEGLLGLGRVDPMDGPARMR
ncbi:hypothetical protein GCM10011577_35520 [Pseudarthrobacter polychromogenes]|uniref:Uncharacterized protein n=1 Tax=Pseudarthrobacter polychromogenes TaxID=1676 RepID=A0ABQ1XZD9_9MICC|nr:hypothetical protein GCM10011577_35520 [Pseudarthrobacter polychromogenes]